MLLPSVSLEGTPTFTLTAKNHRIISWLSLLYCILTERPQPQLRFFKTCFYLDYDHLLRCFTVQGDLTSN